MTESVDVLAQTPESLVEAAYRLISFGPGGDPAWTSFRSLFAERRVLALRLFPEDLNVSIMTLEDYVHRQIRDEMKVAGYEERPIDRHFFVTGDVAQAHVRFEMVYGRNETYEGVDLFQMLRSDGLWQIVSIIGDLTNSAPMKI